MAGQLLQIKEYDQQKLEKYGFSVNSCAVQIKGVYNNPVEISSLIISLARNSMNRTLNKAYAVSHDSQVLKPRRLRF